MSDNNDNKTDNNTRSNVEKGYQPSRQINEGYIPTTSEHTSEETPKAPDGGSGKSD